MATSNGTNAQTIRVGTRMPKVASKDKSIPNKVLYVSLTNEWPYKTDGKNVVLSYDLLNDIIYEISAELAFMVKGVEIADKFALLLDFKNERPEDYELLEQAIWQQIISKLFLSVIPDEVSLTFPESYIDWLVYNTNRTWATIGQRLREKDNHISLYTDDIYNEYIENGLLSYIKHTIEENSEIAVFTIVYTNLEDGPILQLIKQLRSDLVYSPYNRDWIQAELGWTHANGIGVDKNDANAIPFYTNAAEAGNAFAMNQLGYAYQCGLGVSADAVKAFHWYKKAAELGNIYGCANLGYCYDFSIGTHCDYVKAAEWYEKAAQNGIDFAKHKLAIILYEGKNGQKDLTNAFKWYKEAADSPNYSNAAVKYYTGLMLLNGEGVENNEDTAFDYLRKASDMGYADAHFLCGQLVSRGVGTFGCMPDPKWAFDEFYSRGANAQKRDTRCCLERAKYMMSHPGGKYGKIDIDQELFRAQSDVPKNPECVYYYHKYRWENPELNNGKDESDLIIQQLEKYKTEYPAIQDLINQIKSDIEQKKQAEELERQRLEAEKQEAERLAEEAKRLAEEARIKAEEERRIRMQRENEEKRKERERLLYAVKCFNQCSDGMALIKGKNGASDIEKGMRILVESARAGDARAKAWVGYRLLVSSGKNRDALKLLEDSLKGCSRSYLVDIGNAMMEKIAFPKLEKNSPYTWDIFLWEQSKIKYGIGLGYALLGWCYINGIGVPKDISKGHELLDQGIKCKSGYAYTFKGICYMNGIGVVNDMPAAMEWFKKGSRANNCHAFAMLGLCYLKSGQTGNAWENFEQGAMGGDASAMCNWADACLYRNDKAAAEKWFKNAIISSEGNKEIIEYATKQLKKIGGTIPTWRPANVEVYFDDKGPTLVRPAGYTPPVESTSATIKKSDDNDHKSENKKEKGGFFKKLFG